jgi:hypothetical protein
VSVHTRLCGEKTGHVVETVKNNQATVTFSSDHSYVDRGFNVTYKAINSLDRKSENSGKCSGPDAEA